MILRVGSVKRRAYRSSIRRGDAPALVCEAAYRLFSTKGYLATSIEDIAAEAGVARPTVFTAVGPKPVILRTVVDQALAGDDAPVPIAERSWWREAIEEPDSTGYLAGHQDGRGSRRPRLVRSFTHAERVDRSPDDNPDL